MGRCRVCFLKNLYIKNFKLNIFFFLSIQVHDHVRSGAWPPGWSLQLYSGVCCKSTDEIFKARSNFIGLPTTLLCFPVTWSGEALVACAGPFWGRGAWQSSYPIVNDGNDTSLNCYDHHSLVHLLKIFQITAAQMIHSFLSRPDLLRLLLGFNH